MKGKDEDDKRIPPEPVPETEPSKKRKKEEEFFIREEKKKLEKMREKMKRPLAGSQTKK